jgi:hypothetical protein
MRSIALAIALAAVPQEKPTLKDFEWLAGRWEGEHAGGTFEEHWTTPVGGLMIGMGRHTAGGKTTLYEFLRIVETREGIEYRVSVQGEAEVAFTLKRVKDGEALFENPEHDFPTRILYIKEKDGSLTARIEGEQGGKTRRAEFKLKRK